MPKSESLAQNVLNGINNLTLTEVLELLDMLRENLELKEDPDPIELHLIESIDSTTSRWKAMESTIRHYTHENKSKPMGTRLSELYSKINSLGSSKIFDD